MLGPYFTQMTEEEARTAKPIIDCMVRVGHALKFSERPNTFYTRFVETDHLPLIPNSITNIEEERQELLRVAAECNRLPPYREPTVTLDDGTYLIVDDRVRPNLIQINFDDGRVGLVCELDNRVGRY
jgi:hypothetical protein